MVLWFVEGYSLRFNARGREVGMDEPKSNRGNGCVAGRCKGQSFLLCLQATVRCQSTFNISTTLTVVPTTMAIQIYDTTQSHPSSLILIPHDKL